MRKIIVLEFISLDGIIQAPGGPEEDPAEDFAYGGWTAPYGGDDAFNKVLQKEMKPADLLLGRKTFDIWENYWPKHADLWEGVNDVTKYVLSTTKTSSDWQNTVFLKSIEDIKKLKDTEGSDLKIRGSSKLVQSLLADDLIDELWLKTYPVVLGKGKRLFDDTSIPRTFTLKESTVTSDGLILTQYAKAGEVKTGTVGE